MIVIDNEIKIDDEERFNDYIESYGLLNSSRSRLAFNMLSAIDGKDNYENKKKLFGLLSHLFAEKPTMRLTAEEANVEKIFAWSDNRIGRMVREGAQDIFETIPNVVNASELERSTIRSAIASMCLSMIASSCKQIGLNEYTFHLDDSEFGSIDTRIKITESKFEKAAVDYIKHTQ